MPTVEGWLDRTGRGPGPQSRTRLLAAPPRWQVTAPVRDYCRAIAPLQNDRWRRVFGNIDAVIGPAGPREFLLPGMANLFLDKPIGTFGNPQPCKGPLPGLV